MQHSTDQPLGLLQDVLTPVNHNWTTFPYVEDDYLLASSSSSSFLELISSSMQPTFQSSETIFPTLPNLDSFDQIYEYGYNGKLPTSTLSIQETYPTMAEPDDNKIYEKQQIPAVFSAEKKGESKKVEGQPSKNLMAERRRRKRLNDRLSMLRSIVPRISKMDRTSILGDTIDYMKDLLEKINGLKSDSNTLNLKGRSQSQARNPTKFEVERRNVDTRIEICCSTKPGLVLSTVNTLEALGLDIQECVISSFSDFSVQASCFEAPENHMMTSSEEIKQILFRNAGYGGRCL